MNGLDAVLQELETDARRAAIRRVDAELKTLAQRVAGIEQAIRQLKIGRTE